MNKLFVNDTVNGVVKEIVNQFRVSYEIARDEFCKSETYRLICERGVDFYFECSCLRQKMLFIYVFCISVLLRDDGEFF